MNLGGRQSVPAGSENTQSATVQCRLCGDGFAPDPAEDSEQRSTDAKLPEPYPQRLQSIAKQPAVKAKF
jgi:hypothetical protein